ncbi:MAG TPA: sodium:solute symporter family protein [Woeseiaceae bacterium]|nr:sodium:solute symporter family protein [Woeseiaceae bacterium]
MTLQTMTYLVVGATFALYIGIAIWARAGTTKDFYVAGGGVHPVSNGMATAADWMSAASFISMAGLIAFMGYGGSVFLMGWTGGYVLLAMLLAPYLRKFGKFTVPEFIGDRYYSRTARIVAVICLIVASITYVIGQMKGIGVAFSRFLEVDYDLGLAIGMAIVFFYAVMGGMKGITYTQIAQYCVLILAYTIPAIFISLNLTGNPIPQIGLGSTMAGSETFLLDKLDRMVTDLGFHEYTTNARLSLLNMFMYTLSLMIGTAGLPHVIIRFFTVPKVKDARSSAGWALVFIAILYTTAPAVAAMARLNLMETMEPKEGEYLVYEERPSWFRKWETTGLLDVTDKNDDGRIRYSADPEVNELTKVDNDIMVLANPEIAKLPNWVIALVAAGGLAAALSTAAGLLLAISSAISHDLLKGVFMPRITERQELRASRIAMAGAIVVAGYLGFNPPDFAAGTVALAFGLAASSIFPALMMGIFSQRMNKEGAIAGMICGILFTFGYIVHFQFLGGTKDQYLLGISPEGIGFVGMLINFAVAFAVMPFTKAPPQEVADLIENVRYPGGKESGPVDH